MLPEIVYTGPTVGELTFIVVFILVKLNNWNYFKPMSESNILQLINAEAGVTIRMILKGVWIVYFAFMCLLVYFGFWLGAITILSGAMVEARILLNKCKT